MKNLSLLFFTFVFLIACQNNKTEENTTNENNKENFITPKKFPIEINISEFETIRKACLAVFFFSNLDLSLKYPAEFFYLRLQRKNGTIYFC